MATIDLSRFATDFRKHYTSVRAQMGRILTDDDHNENERLHAEDDRITRVHVIGPSGSPDGGFLISNPTITGGHIDFTIGAGAFYLGGNRLELEAPEQFQVQSDWINMTTSDKPAPPGGVSRFDLVFLECLTVPTSSVEDSECFEVALAGPDCGVRMRLMRRVHVEPGVTSSDCHQAWDDMTGTWAKKGLGTINAQNELVVDTKLKIGFDAGTAKQDLCTPPVAGGYLGAENQAVRVQLVDGSHFTWGFDNAAPLYRATIGPNAIGQLRKVTLQTAPKDQAHWLAAGQIVELLPWSAVLPNLEKTAEVQGELARIDVSYDPNTQEFFLAANVPATFNKAWLTRPDANDLKPEFCFVRIWDRGSDMASPVKIPFVTGTAAPLGHTGLTVTFTGSDHHPDDFWIIAARPESPDRVVPWSLEAGRGPQGIRRFYTPLAVIEWTPAGKSATGTVIDDCRDKFPPLTRIRTCCTYTVGDGEHSFGAFTKIQDAIDALPADGGEVCLLPGIYRQNFEIKNRRRISVHGCGRHTILRDGSDGKKPIITIIDSQRIDIRDLAIEAPQVLGIKLTSSKAAEQKQVGLEAIDLERLLITVRDRSAIDCRGGRYIRIRHCSMLAQPLDANKPLQGSAGFAHLVVVRADDVLIEHNQIIAEVPRRSLGATGGLHIGGGSERVEICRNKIQGGNGNGITFGSVTYHIDPNTPIPGLFPDDLIFVPGFHFVIGPDGCLHPEPDPKSPKWPPGVVAVPESDGELIDIRVLDNDIYDMGLNGIATLRFSLKSGPITVRLLDVERNRIWRCLQLELGNQPFNALLSMGFGGVSLLSVENFTLRENRIERNGRSFVDPICGVFVLMGRGLSLEDNVIIDNGPLAETNQQPTGGIRGGIFISAARSPLTSLGSDKVQELPFDAGLPAARIAGNTVVAPLGPALHLAALGMVSVEANELTSMGVAPEGTRLGVTVRIVDIGTSYETGGQVGGFSTMGLQQPASMAVIAARAPIGGRVLFNDNQVLLMTLAPGEGPLRSSILLVSLDHVLMDGNQAECRFGANWIVHANAFVMGWSLHVTDNRFVERLGSPGVSAYTYGFLNATTDNIGTRCFTILGQANLTIRDPNRSLVMWNNVEACEPLRRLIGQKMKAMGME